MQSHLQLKSLCDYFSFLQSDIDGSVRLSVHQINEWFENDHMLSPLGTAQHTEEDTPRPSFCSAASPSNLTAAAYLTPKPADGTILLIASK